MAIIGTEKETNKINKLVYDRKGPVIIYRLGGGGSEYLGGGSHGFLKTFRGDQP